MTTPYRLSGIVHLFLITLICGSMIEGGYLVLARFILDSPGRSETREADRAERSEEPENPHKQLDYHSILQRNLFGLPPDNNRSAVPLAAGSTESAVPNLQIVLMGTITGNTGIERAVIFDKKNKQQQLYEKGDEVQGGALVNEIRRGKVILAKAGKEEVLDISEAAKVRPPPIQEPPVPAKNHAPLPVISQPSATDAPGQSESEVPVSAQPAKIESAPGIQVSPKSSPDHGNRLHNKNLRIIPKSLKGE